MQKPYRNFPWGDEADATKANWPESKNPFRAGPQPWTTPVGFFDGKMHRKAELNWPGDQETCQAANGANGYGLYDMAGNVWQFVNDWYARDYYAYSPAENPAGPQRGSVMPDGKAIFCTCTSTVPTAHGYARPSAIGSAISSSSIPSTRSESRPGTAMKSVSSWPA
jgi:formylglycine-generating enzyme required for sulfatase activity